ncbi:amino acid adenylation domain-containing protein [Pedobacter aquatilis]|uniref:non-ribosomal peptide synthetase n=1 Tax=Pedobacter aquatilis TaxID=351343 RepID=UPI00292EB827|nr:amino acid adenylation domain-containing protein [Pedobacter aquatilis]
MTSLLKEDITSGHHFENASIPKLIHQQYLKTPEKTAIKHNGKLLNYRDLDLDSNRIANFLFINNIQQNDVVAVAMDRSIEMSVCLLSLLKAGATYLPIDPKLPVERVNFLIKDTGSKILITSQKYAVLYAGHKKLIFDDIYADLSALSDEYVENVATEKSLMYIIYTSGSTGVPKGVGIKQQSLLNLLTYRQKSPGVGPSDNMLGMTTMSFDISQEELYLPLISGAQLTIIDQDVSKDGQALLEVLTNESITIMQATPYVWQMMLEVGWNNKLPIKAFCGGEALTKDLANKLLKRCNEVWNMYGPTETTICSIVKKLSNKDELITIGKPISNTHIYILDEHLDKVKNGVEGELYIGGAGVSDGYINRPELTAEKFVKDKFSAIPGAKMYKTGDMVKMHRNGDIQFIGRIDSQIKIRGYRIETEEIEFHLRANSNIKDALVLTHSDDKSNLRLIAYLTLERNDLKNNAKYLIVELKEALKKVLPEYMVPVDYIILDAMPLMPSGKVNRNALPKPEIKSNALEYIAPETEMEKIVADVWGKNIGIEKIGVNDNFFDLGGTSLIAVKTKIELEKITNKRFSPSILFKYPTIKQLALLIEGTAIEQYKSLIPIKPNGSNVPLYIIHGIGLNVLNFRQMALVMDENQPVYGLQAVFSKDVGKPLATIEDIAGFYNSEIITQNPNGPYAIAGYSIGGVIAYEMVKQLKRAGKDVKLLVMFDTAIQIPTHQYPLLKKIGFKFIRQFLKLRFRISSFIKQPTKNIEYFIAVYKNQIAKLNGFSTAGLPDYMVETIHRITKAFYHYKVEPYHVKIDLFVAKKFYYLDDPKYLGWKKYALDGVNPHNISSGHDDMFDSGYYFEIADVLQKKLNEIN